MSELDRRTFITGISALAASALTGCKTAARRDDDAGISVGPTTEPFHGLGAEEVDAPTMSDGRPALRAQLIEADGSPLEMEKMRTLHARDMHNDPLPQPIVLASGRARIAINSDEPIQLVCRLKVPNFGEVYCYADNNGRGYTRAAQIEYVVDAAETRAKRVRDRWEKLRRTGLTMGPEFHDRLVQASRPMPKAPANYRIAEAYERLAHGLHAGEQLAMANARYRISKLPKPRQNFEFGVMVSGFNSGPVYEQHVKELFDFATCSWYTWKDEKSAAAGDWVDYARMDASIDWCLKRGINPKTFGYLYMARGATPEWIRPIEPPPASKPATTAAAAPTTINTMPNSEPSNAKREFNPNWPYDRVKELYRNIIRQTCKRYDGKVQHVEVMNEAHDKANLWGMNHEQILDFAKMAFSAAREGSATMRRQMNHCCMWGEYAKSRNGDGSRRWSPYQFVKACFDNGIDYETIGVQLYYPQHDVFEIDRMLDRMAEFGKPLHITEIATASQDGLDPESMRPKTYAPGWHGAWNPTIQADWSEAMWTLCYSKPLYEEVGWWDFTDVPGHFWPFGGLLQKDLAPKEAFHRLKKLKQDWGLTERTV